MSIRDRGLGILQALGSIGSGVMQAGGGVLNYLQQNPEFVDRSILALEGLAQRPNQPLMQMASANIAQRQQERQLQNQANEASNFFMQQSQPQLAEFVRSNPALAPQIMASFAQRAFFPEPTEPTAVQQNYSVYLAQQDMQNRERIQQGLAPETPLTFLEYQQSVSGRNLPDININTGDQPEPRMGVLAESRRETLKSEYEAQRERLSTIQEQNSKIQQMTSLMLANPNSSQVKNFMMDFFPALSEFAGIMDPFSRSAMGLRYELTPTFREEGSGSTSDFEMTLYLSILPRFLSSPEAVRMASIIWDRKQSLEQDIMDLYNSAGDDATIQEELAIQRQVDQMRQSQFIFDEATMNAMRQAVGEDYADEFNNFVSEIEALHGGSIPYIEPYQSQDNEINRYIQQEAMFLANQRPNIRDQILRIMDLDAISQLNLETVKAFKEESPDKYQQLIDILQNLE